LGNPLEWPNFLGELPGLVNIQKAIEHGPVEIVDLPIKNSDFPVRKLLVYQRVAQYHSKPNDFTGRSWGVFLNEMHTKIINPSDYQPFGAYKSCQIRGYTQQ
jgi:hypothetical protein